MSLDQSGYFALERVTNLVYVFGMTQAAPDHPIKKYRRSKGLSLAKLAVDLGVKKITISRWENGKRMPRPKDWPRIAMVTGVTPAELANYRASSEAA